MSRRDHSAHLAHALPALERTQSGGFMYDSVSVLSSQELSEYDLNDLVDLDYSHTAWPVFGHSGQASPSVQDEAGLTSVPPSVWADQYPCYQQHVYKPQHQKGCGCCHQTLQSTAKLCSQTCGITHPESDAWHSVNGYINPRLDLSRTANWIAAGGNMTPCTEISTAEECLSPTHSPLMDSGSLYLDEDGAEGLWQQPELQTTTDAPSVASLPDVDPYTLGSVMLPLYEYPKSPPESASSQSYPGTPLPGMADSDILYIRPMDISFSHEAPTTTDLEVMTSEPASPFSATSTPTSVPRSHSSQESNTSPSTKAADPYEADAENEHRCWDHGCEGRKFSTRGNLVRHQREKAKRQSFYCYGCGACFSRTTARDKHLLNQSCSRIRRYSNGRIRPKYAKLLMEEWGALVTPGTMSSSHSTSASAKSLSPAA